MASKSTNPFSSSLSYVDPYLGLSRVRSPTGWFLFFWPTAWAALLSASASTTVTAPPHLVRAFLQLAVWSYFTRGAACTINDVLDRDLDAQVARTKTRPLACGQITVSAALVWFILQVAGMHFSLSGFSAQTHHLNAWSVIIGALYPLFKRFTYWPHIACGLCVNPGALVATAALSGHIQWSISGPLYAAGTLWTMGYECVYSHQDRRDDATLGVYSPALLYQSWTKPIAALFMSAALALFASQGLLASLGRAYYLIGVLGSALHLAVNLYTVDLDDAAQCGRYFRRNRQVGAILAAGIVMDWVGRGCARERVYM